MCINKEIFINEFSKLTLDGRTSLFLGAGGSVDAGYPSWGNLFKPLADALKVTIDDTTDYYKLAQYYTNEFGSASLLRIINDNVNRHNFESLLIDELINIGFSNVWTTNFDNVIERNYQERSILTNKIFKDKDLSNVDINKRINIFKMNGDISNLDGIIATQSNFEGYSDTHKLMLMFLKRELISSTFLFIGYSFTDHLILGAISELQKHIGDIGNFHYTVIKKEEGDKNFYFKVKDLEERYKIRVLLVDEYKEVQSIIKQLNDRIKSKKVFVSGSFSYRDSGIEEYSHALSKVLTSKLLSNDYRIVNGVGRRFGTHIIGYANEHLAREGIKDLEKHMIVKPFVSNNENVQNRTKLREKVINGCGSAIFVFGDKAPDSNYGTSGVWEEYEIAKRLGLTIIPILYPNMVSNEIWKDVKNNLTVFPYLERNIDKLTYETDINNLIEIILDILKTSHISSAD